MFCGKCGKELKENSNYCSYCGNRVQISGQTPGYTQTSNEFKLVKTKCEGCGALTKRISPNHYLCEYCGSEYFVEANGTVAESKITEKETLELFLKAATFETKEQYWDELMCLLQAVDKLSDNVSFCVKLGRAYRRNNMYDKAIEWYEKAQDINPDYATTYTNLSTIYYLLGQFEKDEFYARKGVELMNNHREVYNTDDYAAAYSNLAVAVGMQGRKEEAKQYLQIAEKNGYKKGDTIRKMIGIRKSFFSL